MPHKVLIQEVGASLFERINRPDNRSSLRSIRRAAVHVNVAFDGRYQCLWHSVDDEVRSIRGRFARKIAEDPGGLDA